MLARPKLVVDDPWLEPHELAIQRRIARFESELAAIEKEFGSIRDHADAHRDDFPDVHVAARFRHEAVHFHAVIAAGRGGFRAGLEDTHAPKPFV